MEDAHVAVLLEEVRGQFKAFGESLQATNDKIDRLSVDMSDVKHRLGNVEGRLTDVEGRLTNVEDRLTGVANALNGGSRPRKKR